MDGDASPHHTRTTCEADDGLEEGNMRASAPRAGSLWICPVCDLLVLGGRRRVTPRRAGSGLSGETSDPA